MLLVDAHVHIYDCFDLEKFFASAYANFKSAAKLLDHSNDFTGILLLAETSNENWFQKLSNYADGKALPDGNTTENWFFRHTDEINSLIAESEDSKSLILIAGRQIITTEGLEILALLTTGSFKDGAPIRNLIEVINEKGGLPVIPWGFGKWIGKRGKILNQLIESTKIRGFFLGDSGNRPSFLSYPAQFKLAQNKNILDLPGSDPLPLASEFNKPGSWGFSISEDLDKSKPTVQLKQYIFKKPLEVNTFGKAEGLWGFLKNQLLLGFKKLQ